MKLFMKRKLNYYLSFLRLLILKYGLAFKSTYDGNTREDGSKVRQDRRLGLIFKLASFKNPAVHANVTNGKDTNDDENDENE